MLLLVLGDMGGPLRTGDILEQATEHQREGEKPRATPMSGEHIESDVVLALTLERTRARKVAGGAGRC